MIVSAIVATANNNVIGVNNRIPWYLPADLKYFKKTTLHHHVIMGRKTFESIGRPLPKRTNVVITRNPFYTASNVLVCNSVQQALEHAYDHQETEVFIIGGGKIYEVSLPQWDKIYWTKVDTTIEGDTFFPPIATQDWKLVQQTKHLADQKNEFDYTFEIWERLR